MTPPRSVSTPARRLLAELRLPFARLLGREPQVFAEFDGERVLVEVASRKEIGRAASFAGEALLLRRLLDHLQPGDVFWDVGANIGIVSLLVAGHATGRSGRIHAFEPEPRNFRRLLRNIEINGFGERVRPHAVALGPEAGEARLYVRGGPGEGRHSTVETKGATGSIAVGMTTASAFAAQEGETPDVVKIDVEGAEGRVLAGMEAMLRSARPRELFLEIHPKGEGDRMPDGTLIDDWLSSRGYGRAWEERRGSGLHRHYR